MGRTWLRTSELDGVKAYLAHILYVYFVDIYVCVQVKFFYEAVVVYFINVHLNFFSVWEIIL